MKIKNKSVKLFKMKNRRGFAAICSDCLTEGKTQQQAMDRMVKAILRVDRKKAKSKKR